MDPRPPQRLVRQPGDGWVDCVCGRRHWGLVGAAGLLLFRRTTDLEVVLQHRALWSDHGGTWGIPGGALAPGETPADGAVREAVEEAGVDPAALEVVGTVLLDHGTWRYTTVLARATGPQHPRPTDPESLEVTWVPVDRVADRALLPAFADAWPGLRRTIEQHDDGTERGDHGTERSDEGVAQDDDPGIPQS